MRKLSEIQKAEQEYCDRVWYDRKQCMLHAIQHHKEEMPPEEIMDGMFKSMARVEKKYGKDSLEPVDDFEWGMISGKLSALRWMLGEDWNLLDT